MYAVVVTFTVKSDRHAAFLPLVKANARRSLADEPGCRQFDVCWDGDSAGEVHLYELYDDRPAFDAHCRTPHFLEFDAAVADMVASKQVRTYRRVTQ